jgi:hypothetical protein
VIDAGKPRRVAQALEHRNNSATWKRGIDLDRQALAREVVHDRERSQLPAVDQAVGNVVHRPALVGSLRRGHHQPLDEADALALLLRTMSPCSRYRLSTEQILQRRVVRRLVGDDALELRDVASEIPCLRHSSSTFAPASASFRTAMICSSLNRFFFTSASPVLADSTSEPYYFRGARQYWPI